MPDVSQTVRLAADEVAEVSKPVNGQGGMQDLLRSLIPRITPKGDLSLSPDEVERIRRYATAYGGGGFENRFKLILSHLSAR